MQRAAAPPSIEEKLGARLRALRVDRGITLDQLAASTHLTKGQLSRIENGKVSSPVSTLTRIADALAIDVGELFREAPVSERCILVKRSDRREVVGRASKMGHTYQSLAFNLPFRKAFEPYLMVIEEKVINPDHNRFRHPGQEFLFLLRGNMIYRHGDFNYAMAPGDSLFFDGEIEHGPVSVSNVPVEFVCIIQNPGS